MARKEGSQSPVENVEHGELDEETRRKVERIREKERRGETLTTHEAGVLGGAKRTGTSEGPPPGSE